MHFVPVRLSIASLKTPFLVKLSETLRFNTSSTSFGLYFPSICSRMFFSAALSIPGIHRCFFAYSTLQIQSSTRSLRLLKSRCQNTLMLSFGWDRYSDCILRSISSARCFLITRYTSRSILSAGPMHSAYSQRSFPLYSKGRSADCT